MSAGFRKGIISQRFTPTPSTSSENKQSKRARQDFIETRFKFSSDASKTKKLKLNLSHIVSSSSSFGLEHEVTNDDHQCNFSAALQKASVDNLSNPFKTLYRKIEPLSRSLPLLIYYKEQIVEACCSTLISRERCEETTIGSKGIKLSNLALKNQSVEAEKEKNRRKLKEKERIDLVAATIFEILIPLIVDLSTSLLEPSNHQSPTENTQCPFDKILVTLIYFINSPSANPVALEKASEVVIHLFKTLTKELTSNCTDQQEVPPQLLKIWQLVRLALGAPLPTHAQARHDQSSQTVQDEGEESEEDARSDDEGEPAPLTTDAPTADAINLEDDFEYQTTLPEALELPENFEDVPVLSPGQDPPLQIAALNLDCFDYNYLTKTTMNSTTPVTRKLLAAAFSFLIRKKVISHKLIPLIIQDLNTVAVEELDRNGGLLISRKHKEQLNRKGLGQRDLLGEEKGAARVFAEGICLTLSESCKSIDRRLHSRTAEIILAVDLETVVANLAASNVDLALPTLAQGVLRSLLISILHHSTAEHCDGTLAVLINRAHQRLSQLQSSQVRETDSKEEQLALSLSIESLAVVAGVRRGARITPARKKEMFKLLLNLYNSQILSSLTFMGPIVSRFGLNLLLSVQEINEFLELPEIRKSLDHIFSTSNFTELTYEFASLLRRLHWPFFGDFILPKLFPIMQQNLSETLLQSSSTAGFLADIARPKPFHLPELLGNIVSSKVQSAIESVVRHLDLLLDPSNGDQPEAIMPLEECLDWIDCCISLPSKIKKIDYERIGCWFQKTIQSQDLVSVASLRSKYIEDYKTGAAVNQTFVVSKALDLFASSSSPELLAETLRRLPAILGIWGWHNQILKAIERLCEQAKQQKLDHSFLSFSTVYQHLQPAFLSEISQVRRLSLQILSFFSTSNSEAHAILSQCLKIEDTPISVDTARDRQMHIRKLGVIIRSNEVLKSQPEIIDLAQRYLLAQFKVHFKPIWEETIKSMTEMNERYSMNFWSLVWSQLELTLNESEDLYFTPRVLTSSQQSELKDLPDQSELTRQPQFICTHLEKLESLWPSRLQNRFRIEASGEMNDRLDLQNYEAQLMDLLCHNPSIAQKNNKVVIEAFFRFCQANDEDIDQGHLLGRAARIRLTHWLPLFSKFNNPKALYRSKDLRDVFYDILADPDVNLRRLALECVLTWKDGSLVRHQDNLRDLMESSQLRDALLKLSLSSDGDHITENDRPVVMAVAMRILYGSILMNQGRSSSHGQGPRRTAILSAMKGCSKEEFDLLINLMLRPLTGSSGPTSIKKQLGFLTLLGDVLKSLSRNIIDRWCNLLNIISEILSKVGVASIHHTSEKLCLDGQTKRVRVQIIHRINEFYKHAPSSFSFEPWIDTIFKFLITPRLSSFAAESAQSPSALLELFHTWSSRHEFMNVLVEKDSLILKSVYEILGITNVKSSVVTRVLDILENLLRNIDSHPELSPEVYLKPYFNVLLPNLAELLGKTSSSFSLATSTSRRQITLLSALAPYITEAEHAESFCELIIPLLVKSPVVVPEHVQADLLAILSGFLKISPKAAACPTTVQTVSKLFGTVSARKGRCSLIKVIDAISPHFPENFSATFIKLLTDLNSFSTKRIDEPDFDRRLSAFSQLNEVLYQQLNLTQWLFVIHHSLFQITDPDELSLRSSSTLSLSRFFEIAEGSKDLQIRELVTTVLLPSLKKVLRSKLEIIRQEILVVLSNAIEKDFPEVSELREMRCLLVGGDKEANFFLNVYHIQVHRRTRALRRLADESEAGNLGSKVLGDIFFPLLSSILQPVGVSKSDPDTVNEAIRTLGRIAKVMSWSAYNTVLQYYIRMIHKPDSVNKITVRAVVSIMKSFHFDLRSSSPSDTISTENLAPAPAHAFSVISAKLIPTLIRFMEQQKENGPDESLRIMIAEGVAFVATFLPKHSSQLAISGIVASLSNILKSTHSETRQSAKSAMANIAALLPPSFLVLLLKELKAALGRGPQLHVLAHVVYAIVLKTGELEKKQIAQEAVRPILEIIIEDLFGQPSKERQSKELRAKSKFSETRSSRSLETLQMIISRLSHSDQFKEVLLCFRRVLETTRSTKGLKQVDECFHRLCAGILANKEAFEATTVLDLVHNLISKNTEYLKGKAQAKPKYTIVPTDHRVVLSVKKNDQEDHYAANAHHFVSLGLDLFNTIYRRGGFDLHSPTYLNMIDPMVNLVGNTLYTHNSEVLARGLKVMGILIKLPLPAIENSASVIVRQMLAVVSHIGTSESELSQIALKTLGSVVRDCKKVDLTEKQLTGLLNLIAPDLEDPERQMTLFALLRGIMTKKFMAPELYDLMDRIIRLLVTAQSASVREICRSVFLQFLLDYPQGKGRLTTSLEFLVKNLTYEHESGRQSVLEILNAINTKFGTDLVSKNADLFMIALVMAISNETSTRCKEMAIGVMKVILERIGIERANKYLLMLLSWSTNTSGPIELKRSAIQLLGVFIEVRGSDSPESNVEKVHLRLCTQIQELAKQLESVEEEAEDEVEESASTCLDWELAYQSLQALAKTYKLSPTLILSSPKATDSHPEWNAIQSLLLFPHAWVRSSAARLIGMLLSAEGKELLGPFKTNNLVLIARKSSLQLRSKQLNDTLALQIVKNLFSVLKSLRSRMGEDSNLGTVQERLEAKRSSQQSSSRLKLADEGEEGTDEGEEEEEEEEEGSESDDETDCAGFRLISLIKRLSRQASISHAKRPSLYAVDAGKWSIETASVLRCFAALINHLSFEDLKAILQSLMVPIYRIVEDSNIKDPQMNELQNLAKEVQEFLREKIGTTEFSRVYGKLRSLAMIKRQERKKNMALKAVNYPELSAKRKASRSESKLRNKKRKQESYSQQNARFGKLKKGTFS